ncbi:MAG TPA: pyrrolo-quinoline quinone [Terriglobia bacterium]|nr:pyrrolo-quinoline quinone [Terriglobia bacterium]
MIRKLGVNWFSLAVVLGLVGCGGGSPPPPPPLHIFISVSPRTVSLVSNQAATVTASLKNDVTGKGVTWKASGSGCSGSACGTFANAAAASTEYTAPAAGGLYALTATSVADPTQSATVTAGVTDLTGVFTYHNDLARDGVNPREFSLTPSTVAVKTFGRLFTCPVDGAVYAQPLWSPGLTVGGARHNVIFVATQHDSAYAFDADSSPCVQLWHANLLDAAHGAGAGETPVPAGVVGSGYLDIQPEIGVTSTPVIDPASNTLYLVSKSMDAGKAFHQRLHALDLASGHEKLNQHQPVEVSATVAGSGDGAAGGTLAFNPQTEGQRSGLALVNGTVYVAWASHEDTDPYHGWLIGYNAATLAQVAVFNSTPNGSRGGFWMAGGAPAADSDGNLYILTGNGSFDANLTTAPNNDFSESVLKITTTGGLSLKDWFTPFNQDYYTQNDLDLASAGVTLLPDQPSAPVHLLVAGSKIGTLYVLDRDALGGYCGSCTTSDTNARQSFSAFVGAFGTPAFWQNSLYLAGSIQFTGDNLKAFAFNPATGQFGVTPASQSSLIYNFPGATPSVSSAGASNGIVWAIDSSQYGVPSPLGSGPAVLHAYDATNLAREFWESALAPGNRDQAGAAVKFTVPTVANGKVYIGTRTEIDVFGLFPNPK